MLFLFSLYFLHLLWMKLYGPTYEQDTRCTPVYTLTVIFLNIDIFVFIAIDLSLIIIFLIFYRISVTLHHR